MRQTHRQSSVLDCFAPFHRDSARQCLRRAAVCSRLAKLVRGQGRKKLYRLKNENLQAALRTKSDEIEVCCDKDRYFGLLSIRLRGTRAVRVHTHEGWIGAA